MGPIWLLVRAEVRSRRLALLGLVLLTAVATGVVLTAAVGARRTSTAVERFRTWSRAADVLPQSSSQENADQITEIVRRLPYVTAWTQRSLVNGFPAGGDDSTPDFAMYTDPSGRYGVAIDRPRILEGRTVDPAHPDEVVIDELTARLLRRGVGDRIRLATWTPQDLEALFGGGSFPGFNGPPLDLRVVGISRSPATLQGDVGRASLTALVGPRFLAAHPGIGAWPPVVVSRLADPARDGDRFARALAPALRGAGGRDNIESASAAYGDATRRTTGALTTGLWIFATVAALAGAVVVGQAVGRQVAMAARRSEVTRGLGLSSRSTVLATAIPAVLAGAVGAAIGAVLAVAASPLLPTGLARRAEIDPGIWIDPTALAVGVAVALLVVVAWAWVAAVGADGRSQRGGTRSSRSSAVADRLASWGTPQPLVLGVRHAFEKVAGASVPVRSAFVAAAVAVTGVVGAGVVATSLDGLRADPHRWGWNWDSTPDAFGDRDPTKSLAADRRLRGVGLWSAANVVTRSGVQMSGNSLESVRGAVDFVLVTGRLPNGRSEVALDRAAMEASGARIGDRLALRERDGKATTELAVVGEVVLPWDPNGSRNAVVVRSVLDDLAFDGAPTQQLVLQYPAGADRSALEAELRADHELSFPLFARPTPPAPVGNLAQGRGAAVALAVFFAVLGVAGLFHALVSSVNARRDELGVLRAIGLRRRQIRRVVDAQAAAIAAVAVLVGLPLGVVAGRIAWARLVAGAPVLGDPTTRLSWLAVAVAGTLGATVVVAFAPARLAQRASRTARRRDG